MLDLTLQARFEKLLEARISEQRKQFQLELGQIDAQAASYGRFHSGSRLLRLQQVHESELAIRAILTWESLVRVHRTFGCPMSDTLREDLKAEMSSRIAQCFSELNWSLTDRVQKTQANLPFSLNEARLAVAAKHDIEIDLYVDSLSTNTLQQGTPAMTQNYNFYGNVGSVQTGANSVANVVQNLDADDRASLSSALQQVKEALSVTPSIEDTQRRELLEIAEECASQMAAKAPNNTKLLTMFNVLGTAIQSIASAQPAYQALKMALLPLGITLP
jgi:hypothetical protein